MSADPAGSRRAVAPSPDGATKGERPAAAAKLLGSYLRSLRLERRLTIKEAAPAIRASVSKISRLERGESPPSPRDVMELVHFYGVADPADLEAVRNLVRDAGAVSWTAEYADITPGWFRRLIGLEGSAHTIRIWENVVVPGILQTRDYAEALIRSGRPDASASEIERRVSQRNERIAVMAENNPPPDVTAIIDESALYRTVGSPAVMAGQLRKFRDHRYPGSLSVRILSSRDTFTFLPPPFAFTHLAFRNGGPSEVLYMEHLGGATYTSRDGDLQRFRKIMDRLLIAVGDPAASQRCIDRALAHHLKRPGSHLQHRWPRRPRA